MKVDRRDYCFSCGCTGDAIDFTAQLFGIGLKDAAMKLADDFRIPYSGKDRESQQNKRRVPIKKPKPTPEELWQKKYLRCMRAYLDYRSLLLEWKEQYAPKTWTEEWNEKFMTSLSELTVVEYYLDILLFGDRADKEVLVKEKWKEIDDRIRKLKERRSTGRTANADGADAGGTGCIVLTGKNVAQISDEISNPVIAGIIYWLIRILICGGCLVGAGILVAFIGIEIAGVYKKCCWDMITILVTIISMEIAIYFGDWIKTRTPINLLFLLLFVQLVYVAIRWYMKGWRDTRSYY